VILGVLDHNMVWLESIGLPLWYDGARSAHRRNGVAILRVVAGEGFVSVASL
jgi:hypothetical protein